MDLQKLFVLIFSLISFSSSQDPLFCTYNIQNGSTYSCQLEIINNFGTDDFNHIHGLHLSSSELSQISLVGFSLNFPQIVCETFKNLTEISSSSLGIVEIDENCFKFCESLATLDLSGNSIFKVDSETFKENSQLSELSLAENRISTLDEKVFERNLDLKVLKLFGNFFKSFPSKIFDSFRTLETFDAHNCKLNFWDSNWFKNLQNLQTLDVSENFIEEIPRNSFNSRNSLKILKLNGNKIQQIEFLTFESLENLEELNLSGNGIEALDYHLLSIPGKLKVVKFEGNLCFDGNFENFERENLKNFSNCFEKFYSKTLDFSTLSYQHVINSIFDPQAIFSTKSSESVEIFLQSMPNSFPFIKIKFEASKVSIRGPSKEISVELSQALNETFLISWNFQAVTVAKVGRHHFIAYRLEDGEKFEVKFFTLTGVGEGTEWKIERKV